jgi:uncharacterized protein (TIGR00730 family)
MKRICLFCGSSHGARAAYAEAAAEFGRTLALRGIGLVYGGCSIGLMDVAANAALAAGGEVIGVVPEPLVALEIAHPGLTELRVVGSMHERKAQMAELSDGFAALPGGLGTLDEMFEILTWSQLGFHDKPCGFLNIEGYFDHLLRFLDHCVAESLLRRENRETILVAGDIASLLDQFAQYKPAESQKWLRELKDL